MGRYVARPLIMVPTDRPDAIFFSLPQLRTLAAWGAARPKGFSISVAADHRDDRELASLFKDDPRSPLWFLYMTQGGTAVLTKASAGSHELNSVEEALARVLELEQ